MRVQLASLLGLEESKGRGKYLGLPYLGRGKKEIFGYLRERISKKTRGWKEKLLFQAGKEILIKFVLQAIPSYVVSIFLFLKLCVMN